MPMKKKYKKRKGADEGEKKIVTKMKDAALCSIITPGPKYLLKTLVGYKGHCISKFRNPAYTFDGRRPTFEAAEGPGPKYMIKERRPGGFTFGCAVKHRDIAYGPGPQYLLPDVPRGPFFSMKWRTKPRKGIETPGPYYVKPIIDAPAFSMGLRTIEAKPIVSAGLYSPNLNAIKPRAPMYTMGCMQIARIISTSPGPIYAIKPPKLKPAFSFGVKHSECAPPYITECDKQC